VCSSDPDAPSRLAAIVASLARRGHAAVLSTRIPHTAF